LKWYVAKGRKERGRKREGDEGSEMTAGKPLK